MDHSTCGRRNTIMPGYSERLQGNSWLYNTGLQAEYIQKHPYAYYQTATVPISGGGTQQGQNKDP